MFMHRVRSLALVAVATLAATGGAACSADHPLSPTAPTVTAPAATAPAVANFLGTWSSSTVSESRPLADSLSNFDLKTCGNFQWTISSQTDDAIAGTFTALCMGAITVTGTASGQITTPTTVALTINGSGTIPDTGDCAFTLSSTGTIEGDNDALALQFTGTSCVGPFSGHETLHRGDIPGLADPEPPTQDPPPPPDTPQQEPWELCAPLTGDKLALVRCVHDAIDPGSSADRAFEVTTRVAWLLRGEGAGLLIKDSGENIIFWKGSWFSLSRVCYPDGHIFKILTDAGDGGTNGPGWADDDFVDRSRYVPAIDPR
jgi:hypothetical protein